MAAYRQVYDMHVCRCGPGGRWWQPTTGFITMHDVRLTALSPVSAPALSLDYDYGYIYLYTDT